MGNTVTCCVSPDASPKLGRARGGAGGAAAGPERWADAYQAAASGGGSGSAEADSGDSEPGGGGGPHLQHISDREFPDGERRAAGLAGRHGGERNGAEWRGAVPPAAPLCPGGTVPRAERAAAGSRRLRRTGEAPGRAQ